MKHFSFVFVGAVIFLGTVIGTAQASLYRTVNITLDTLGGLASGYVDLVSTDPNFSGHSGPNIYAGLFSGHDDQNNTYYFFCSELNHNIFIGQQYAMNVYDTYTDTPFQNGNPPHAGGLINETQKELMKGLFAYLGVTGGIMGFLTADAQDLSGILMTNPDKQKLLSITNEQAMAAQIGLWEIVHEPYTGPQGLSLDEGILRWKQNNGSEFSDEFKALFKATMDQTAASVPEPATIALLVCGLAGMVWKRPRRSLRQCLVWASRESD